MRKPWTRDRKATGPWWWDAGVGSDCANGSHKESLPKRGRTVSGTTAADGCSVEGSREISSRAKEELVAEYINVMPKAGGSIGSKAGQQSLMSQVIPCHGSGSTSWVESMDSISQHHQSRRIGGSLANR